MGDYAIEINNLTKSYGKYRGIIDLSLSVDKGDIFGFLGPNGAGKSTTIRSILGMIHFKQGNAKILGMDVVNDHVKILDRIGYMPSEAMFYSDMKVSDVIKFSADMHKKDCSEEAAKICDRLKVDTNKKIEELSLGNRKKVSIVCAMQHKPDLFIFDEPTSGLDPLMQVEFFNLIEEYNKEGATCFLSSHVLSEVKKYCNKAAIIREGKLIKVDTVESLTSSHSKNIRVVKDGEYEEFKFKGNLNDLIADLSKHNITDLHIEDMALEDIFMHYYEKEDK